MSNKTILDILLERNRISQEEAQKFDRSLGNAQIEEKLKNEKSVSSEDIAKSYALLYDLPYIRLENYNVSPDAFKLIPEDLILKYKIVAFEKDGNIPGAKVKFAFGNPGELKSNPPEILDQLKREKNISADLYITTSEDIEHLVKRFKEGANVVQVKNLTQHVNYGGTTGLKSVDLKLIKIPYEIITKFPVEISKKYKMVVFESPSPSMIKVAVSDPYDPKVQEILDFVRSKNDIAIEEFVASPGDINEAIKNFYQKKEPPPLKSPITFTLGPQVSSSSPLPPPKPYQPQPKTMPAPTLPKPKYYQRPENAPEAVPQVTAPQEKIETQVVVSPSEGDLDKFLGQEVTSVDALKEITEQGSVPHILAAVVAFAVLKKASDIHIEPEETNLRIRYRIDGVLRDIIKMPMEIQAAMLSRIKILSHLKIDEQRIPQDGRFDVKTHGHEIDLRVSTLPTVRGEKAALRILDKSQNIYSFDQLGITGRNQKVLEENIVKPYGVILATGPTGSGKSTTLYSILQKISTPQVNVITLEDPVEYEIPGINQCQVKPKIGFSFAEGLRSVLRQDPNIIMVGEIRDAETAGMATHAALTGHLVLTTLHTNDAAGALPRLTNMGIEPFLITSSVNVIMGQRLVRKLCEHCKKEAHLPEPLLVQISREIEKFHINGGQQKPYKFYEANGCSECTQGYSGRVGIYEVLAMSEKIEELAIKRRPASEIFAQAVNEGMVTMKQDGLIKAIKGLTTVSEVFRVTTSG